MRHLFAILVLFSLTSCYRPVQTPQERYEESIRLEKMREQRQLERSMERAIERALR